MTLKGVKYMKFTPADEERLTQRQHNYDMARNAKEDREASKAEEKEANAKFEAKCVEDRAKHAAILAAETDEAREARQARERKDRPFLFGPPSGSMAMLQDANTSAADLAPSASSASSTFLGSASTLEEEETKKKEKEKEKEKEKGKDEEKKEDEYDMALARTAEAERVKRERYAQMAADAQKAY